MRTYFLTLFGVLIIGFIVSLGLQSYIKSYNWLPLQSDEYCYAVWTSGGEYWQNKCYKTRTECQNDLSKRIIWGNKVNTDRCYVREKITAYCVDGARPLEIKTDKFGGKRTVHAILCARTKKECQKYERFSMTGDHCKAVSGVDTREGENLYLTPKIELDKLIFMGTGQQDTEVKNVVTKTSGNGTGCTDYVAAPNQQAAFESLGLNWNKTKKWGAFVDVHGNLRANRPSCRLIKRDSEEYNRYK
ncbi:MAG: hypothetical protein K6B71_01685 [Alphaproteobacteria bacterium]|nr:hypothetical protein [Alphaproteobacteria bacterium]